MFSESRASSLAKGFENAAPAQVPWASLWFPLFVSFRGSLSVLICAICGSKLLSLLLKLLAPCSRPHSCKLVPFVVPLSIPSSCGHIVLRSCSPKFLATAKKSLSTALYPSATRSFGSPSSPRYRRCDSPPQSPASHKETTRDFTHSPHQDLSPSTRLVSLITTRRTPCFFAQRIVSSDIKSPHPFTKTTSGKQLANASSRCGNKANLSALPLKPTLGSEILWNPKAALLLSQAYVRDFGCNSIPHTSHSSTLAAAEIRAK